ncbi:MAG: helix-turn-helix domain-containing protein [Bacteroidetes bacterium]|nr:helix-turn-helix domain-containing protein [Bacteroidota bacterium]MDA0907728.1 helix-turn-helix domain-containing protein [Bacteroidota bacterium]|tara:strand:+ start:189 stop:560 length:372 start_codon:yes stop_codon:yes gene_type:complete
MNIQPIHTQSDYQNALERAEKIFDAKTGTPEGDELEILGILIDEYERRQFPIEAPTPIESIKFRMEQLGLDQKKLADILGSKSRASEILSAKRSLSLRQVQILHRELGIPADVLIQETSVQEI